MRRAPRNRPGGRRGRARPLVLLDPFDKTWSEVDRSCAISTRGEFGSASSTLEIIGTVSDGVLTAIRRRACPPTPRLFYDPVDDPGAEAGNVVKIE